MYTFVLYLVVLQISSLVGSQYFMVFNKRIIIFWVITLCFMYGRYVPDCMVSKHGGLK